jgi:predicted NUDIX family phosphoesterase
MAEVASQFVLTVPAKSILDLYDRPAFHADGETWRRIAGVIATQGNYVQRAAAERNGGLKQIVACGILRNQNRVLCLRRSKKSDRESLRLAYTLLIGGHVDREDAASADPLMHCLMREVEEELGALVIQDQLSAFGVAVDPVLSSAGWLHLGIVYIINVDFSEIRMSSKLDKTEFTHARDTTNESLVEVDEVKKRLSSLDPWSGLVVSSDAFRESFGLSALHVQQYLKLA